jgi:two-component system sensor histidine kinase TctE
MVVHRGEAISLTPLDLRIVAQRVKEELPRAFQEVLDLSLPDRPVVVPGDAFSLVEAVKNFVTNGFRYGQAPITIEVLRLPNQDLARIGVVDRGKGIARERWSEVGTRFFKRNSNDAEGAGLGLAIASTVAEAHNGHVALDLLEPEGFRIALMLPLYVDGTSVAGLTKTGAAR